MIFIDKKLMSVGTTLMVLKLLKEKDMYGYQIIKELEEQSEQVFSLKEGTLYPILHNLEVQGAIESYEHVADNKRIRKYYKITKIGRNTLEEKIKEWQLYQKGINKVLGGAIIA
jgi:PadR family transcriptional regulator, regulatory protein PadR